MDLSLLELTTIKILLVKEIAENTDAQTPLYLKHLEELLSRVEKELND